MKGGNGKRLRYFVTNLFRTLCTKFYLNQPIFVEVMTKQNIFSGTRHI